MESDAKHPHKAELFRRRIITSPFCDRCPHIAETTEYMFLGYRGMEEIWQSPPFSLHLPADRLSFWAWLSHLRSSLDADTYLLAVVVMWKAWEIRNSEVHGSTSISTGELVQWCQVYLDSYWRAQTPALSRVSSSNTNSKWSPPPPDFIKINTGVSFPTNHSDMRICMVARDCSGKCIWWSKRHVVGRPKPVDGEARAILHGMKEVARLGWRNIIIESDCLQLISCLANSIRTLASYGALLDACFDLCSSFLNDMFCFVRRSGNTLAHRLATTFDIPCSEGPSLPQEVACDYE